VSDEPQEGEPWRGPTTEEWVRRIAAPILREGETVPLVKPLGVPQQEVPSIRAGAPIRASSHGLKEVK
jgi:hypothetical protein